jgi:hypothetical protein
MPTRLAAAKSAQSRFELTRAALENSSPAIWRARLHPERLACAVEAAEKSALLEFRHPLILISGSSALLKVFAHELWSLPSLQRGAAMLNRLVIETSTALRRSVGLSQPRRGRRYTISNLLDIHRATRSDPNSATFDIKSMLDGPVAAHSNRGQNGKRCDIILPQGNRDNSHNRNGLYKSPHLEGSPDNCRAAKAEFGFVADWHCRE